MVRRWCRQTSEAILLVMVCLAPWAFGAVEAWAAFGLYLGIALLAVLQAIGGWGTDRWAGLRCGVSLGFLGLLVLGWAQTIPVPEGMLRVVAPATASLRAELLPSVPERVLGDDAPPVPFPPATLSQHPERSRDALAQLAAAWLLFQAAFGIAANPGALRRLGGAIVVNSTLLALFAMIQLATWNGQLYWVRPTTGSGNGGPFVCHSHLAAYLNFGLGFALTAVLGPALHHPRPRAQGGRGWSAYAAGLIVTGILTSLSRNGAVAMLAATGWIVVTTRPWTAAARQGDRRFALLGLLAIVALAALFLVAFDASETQERLATLLGWSAYKDRHLAWTGALRAWEAYPVWGVGLGAYATAAWRFYHREISMYYAHAENSYLEAIVEGGVIGLALTLALVGAVWRAAWRAVVAPSGFEPHRWARGAMFGVVALTVQCLGDFPLHIPALGITAVALVGYLARLAADSAGLPPADQAARRVGVGSNLMGLAIAMSSLLPLLHGLTLFRTEATLVGSGLPAPGTQWPTATLWGAPAPELDRAQEALEQALRVRPDWAEGHLRLGLIQLSQYYETTSALLEQNGSDPAAVARMANPLWLHQVIHATSPEQLAAAGGVLGQEPVREYLVPAARSFLEARRCCLILPVPHAELASLDYLLIGGDTGPAYAARAARLAGPDTATLAVAAEAASQAGDVEVAVDCLRRMLESNPARWTEVADATAGLPPEMVLERVVPSGELAFRFAEHLYAAPDQRANRDRFLQAAVARLPQDTGLPPAERLRLEAVGWARLDDRAQARNRMEAALALDPGNAAWRRELVEWLLAWGLLEEAHQQARLGLYFAPDQEDTRKAAELAAEALARGPQPPESVGSGSGWPPGPRPPR